MSYQGWKNYETWAVKLWLDNEEPTYRYWREAAEEAWNEAEADDVFTRSENARGALARRLKDDLDDNADETFPVLEKLNGTMYADLLNAALSEVEWHELANDMLEEEDGYEDKTFSWDG
jgi:hypothetical protein